MFRDRRDEETDHILVRGNNRKSRMPLYLTGFLIAVAVIEQVGYHLLV